MYYSLMSYQFNAVFSCEESLISEQYENEQFVIQNITDHKLKTGIQFKQYFDLEFRMSIAVLSRLVGLISCFEITEGVWVHHGSTPDGRRRFIDGMLFRDSNLHLSTRQYCESDARKVNQRDEVWYSLFESYGHSFSDVFQFPDMSRAFWGNQ